MDDDLPSELRPLVARIVQVLQQEAERYSAAGSAPRIELETLRFTRVVDPENQLPGYEGVWRNARNNRCGIVSINSDCSFFAEYDLFHPHPYDARWFVEMVTAWGNGERQSGEAKLIPQP